MEAKPKKFKPESIKIENKRRNAKYTGITAILHHQITEATVISTCRIPKGSLAVTLTPGYNPDEDPLFLIMCHNFYKATFWLVTDGEIWYYCKHYPARPSRRGTPQKTPDRFFLSNTIKPCGSVDLSELNLIDQQIVQTAIAEFFWSKNNANSHAGSNAGQTSSNQARLTI